MDFRLYSLLCMVASAYCLRPPAEFRPNFSKCPQISSPSVVDHLDINNSGVERLVVHFYKPRNSHQIVTFIPSKEHQNCIEDIAAVAGETINNHNGISIEGLFNRQPGTIRNRKEPTETIPVNFPDHDNTLPNDHKRPDWHIPVGQFDRPDNPWQHFPLAHDHPHKDIPIEIPVIDYQDGEKDNMRPIIGDYDETPLRPDANLIDPNTENAIIGPNHRDILRPNTKEEIEAPIKKHIIRPYHEDKLRPIIREEIDASPIRPLESPITGLNDFDKLRPIIIDDIRPLDNSIIGPDYHDILRPIVADEINASPLKPLEYYIVGPNHHDTLRPIIRDDFNPSPLKPKDNHIIGPNHHDTLRPIIRDEFHPTPLRPIDNHIIGPNHPYDTLRPITRDEIHPSPLRPIDNHIIGPNHHHDTLRPIIRDEFDPKPLRPIDNHITGPNHPHDTLRPIIRDEIDPSPLRPKDNHIFGPNHHHDTLRPIIRDEFDPKPLRPIDNHIIGPNHHDKLRPINWKDQQKPANTKAPVIRPLNYLDTEPNHHNPKLLPIREEIKGSVIRPHDHLPSSRENSQENVDKMKHKLNSDELAPEVINGGLDINDIPKGDNDHSIIEHGDSNESHNGDSHEINSLTHTNSLNFPSEETEGTPDGVNLIYKWHKVKVPRIDSSGKIHGWFWKSVKSPVRSKSVKWSYWQSSGQKHRLTHWKHKSTTSSKIYHHKSTIPDFDGWVKNQIKNMKNKGSKMPSSDHEINNVKVAIEKALETNGIKVKSSGVLTDANGRILRLDNIQLRPIYIGRSLFNPTIHQNSADSTKYRIPADTPFLEGLLVSLIKPAKTLGIVPLGMTALPHVNSKDITKKLLDSGGELHPISIQNGLHKLLNGNMADIGKILPKHRSKVTGKEEDKSLSEEEPEFRIIGGSFAMGSGTPLANRGRSGKD